VTNSGRISSKAGRPELSSRGFFMARRRRGGDGWIREPADGVGSS
jgi:hypothetical protein